MRLVIISDTHGTHEQITIPEGDVLIHAGDCTHYGDLAEVEAFDAWLAELPHPNKVLIAGNHDFAFERQAQAAQDAIQHATYLVDEAVSIEGVSIYGSPWSPKFFDWAFQKPSGAEMAAMWAKIPADTDVLITHGPPKGILDATLWGIDAGCAELRKVVDEIRPKLHIFGHIHEAAGQLEQNGTHFINASIVGFPKKSPVNSAIIVDL